MSFIPADALEALRPVVGAFDRLGVRYHIGGSVASSSYGAARTTADIDLVADLKQEHVTQMIAALGKDYYADEASIRDAILHRGSFNLIHMQMAYKVDVFIPKARPFD